MNVNSSQTKSQALWSDPTHLFTFYLLLFPFTYATLWSNWKTHAPAFSCSCCFILFEVPFFWEKNFEICPSFLFWCKCYYFFHETILSIYFFHCYLFPNPRFSEIISPFSELPKHLLFSGTHYFWCAFPSFMYVNLPLNRKFQWSGFLCPGHQCV